MPDEFDEEQDIEETGQEQSPPPRPAFSFPNLIQQPQQQEESPEPAPRPKPRTDEDTALSDEDVEDIFESGERADGSIDSLERDDFSDLLEVTDEDVTGYKEQPPQLRKQRFSRTAKRFRQNPPPSMGGMSGY